MPSNSLVSSSQFYQPLVENSNPVSTKLVGLEPKLDTSSVATPNTIRLQGKSVSNMNAINDLLTNMSFANRDDHIYGSRRKKIQYGHVHREKNNDILLFRGINGAQILDRAGKNNFPSGFFLHQPMANFPDSGLGDDEDQPSVTFNQSISPLFVKQVPIVVHNWNGGKVGENQKRLSNLSLITDMPVAKWNSGLYSNDDGIEGDNDDDDDDESKNNYARTLNDDDELGRILGLVSYNIDVILH